MATEEPLATGHAALAAGRWGEARTAFEVALAQEETAQACVGLAAALWWLGENQASVSQCTRAYSLFRRAGDVGSAVQCAVWLTITYKANFANFAAASGWIGRAERLLQPLAPGASGKVVGLDLNETMLTVARRVRPDIEFHQGNAAALPFPDGSFDVVACQLALMFFPDAPKLAEMARVVTADGTVAVVVPGRLDAQAAFSPFVDMAARHAGAAAMSLLSTYFVCGDLDELTGLVGSAGLRVTSARTHVGVYRAPSVDAFVTTEVESTPLIERISDEVYQRIRTGTRDVLRPFTAADGTVEAPFECYVLAAQHR